MINCFSYTFSAKTSFIWFQYTHFFFYILFKLTNTWKNIAYTLKINILGAPGDTRPVLQCPVQWGNWGNRSCVCWSPCVPVQKYLQPHFYYRVQWLISLGCKRWFTTDDFYDRKQFEGRTRPRDDDQIVKCDYMQRNRIMKVYIPSHKTNALSSSEGVHFRLVERVTCEGIDTAGRQRRDARACVCVFLFLHTELAFFSVLRKTVTWIVELVEE